MMSPPPLKPSRLYAVYGSPKIKEEEAKKSEEGGDKKGEDDANFDVCIFTLVFGELSFFKSTRVVKEPQKQAQQVGVCGELGSLVVNLRWPDKASQRRGAREIVSWRWNIHPPTL